MRWFRCGTVVMGVGVAPAGLLVSTAELGCSGSLHVEKDGDSSGRWLERNISKSDLPLREKYNIPSVSGPHWFWR